MVLSFLLRYKPAEAAEMLSVSLSKLEEIIREGSLTVHQDEPGGTRYISTESIMAYIRFREEQPVFGRGHRKAG